MGIEKTVNKNCKDCEEKKSEMILCVWCKKWHDPRGMCYPHLEALKGGRIEPESHQRKAGRPESQEGNG